MGAWVMQGDVNVDLDVIENPVIPLTLFNEHGQKKTHVKNDIYVIA